MKLILGFVLLFSLSVYANTHPNYCGKINTQSDVSVSTVSTLVLAENPNRRCLIIQNKNSNKVWVKLDSAHSTSEGFELIQYGSYDPSNVPTNAIYVKSSSGSSTVYVYEGE